MNKYFDIHTHTNMQPLESDFSQIADKCKQLKISYVDVGSNLDNSLVAIEHANKKNNVYACIGIHPEDTKNIDITLAIKNLEDMLIKNSKKRVVAIGETGLDYHYQNYDKKVQTDSFLAHINLAKKYHLSLMVHVRDAYDDCLKILKEYAKDLKVIIHCFTPTIKIAKEYIKEKNLWYSFNGIITFKKANELREVMKLIPLERLLSETDAPYLTPEPYRGKTNSPEYIPYVVDGMSKVLNMDKEKLAKKLYENACEFFNVVE